MKQQTKETLAAAFFGGVGARILHGVVRSPKRGERLEGERWLATVAGALAGAVFVQSHSAARYGLEGLSGQNPFVCRSFHPEHPLHPYHSGVPAVWGGRKILY